MKCITLCFFFVFFGATAQEFSIPDTNFREYLLANEKINTNGDSLIDSVAYWNEAYRKASLKRALRELFSINSYYETYEGFFVGVTNQYELTRYSLGAEVKVYGAVYTPLLSASIYTNYRHLFGTEALDIPSNAISLGGHCSFLGLEATCYFDRKQTLLYLTPKIGLDMGNISLFYGYSLSLNKSNFKGVYGHNIAFKYQLHLSAYSNHRRRVKKLPY